MAYERGAPDLGIATDLAAALRHHKMAATRGNPGSQHFMAVAMATGALSADGATDEVGAVLYDYFAATGGDPEAAAALGYRYQQGLAVPQSCENALRYYEASATVAIEEIRAHGAAPPHERVRLAEVAALGKRAQKHTDAEVVQYYRHTAAHGDAAAMRSLGNLYYHGQRGLPQDFPAAARLYAAAADAGDASAAGALGHMLLHGVGVRRDTVEALRRFRQGGDDEHQSLAGLGYMSMRGIGVTKDHAAALEYFDRAVKTGTSAEALFQVGVLLYESPEPAAAIAAAQAALAAVVKSDGDVNEDEDGEEGATRLGSRGGGGDGSSGSSSSGGGASSGGAVAAAADGSVTAVVAAENEAALAVAAAAAVTIVNTDGELEVTLPGIVVRDVGKALQYFGLAAQHGHLEAAYRLGQMHGRGEGTTRSCAIATLHFKTVAERGPWATRLTQAYRNWQSGDAPRALWEYIRAAEAGSEVAQSNAAWLLDAGVCLGLDRPRCEALALRFYRRAARQQRPEAHLAVGDFLYYGRAGMMRPDPAAAVRSYHLAGEGHNAQALFNLGVMYQAGVGVQRDWNLAKRYYDLSAAASSEAAVPVQLALWSLRLQRALQGWGRLGERAGALSIALVSPEGPGVWGMLPWRGGPVGGGIGSSGRGAISGGRGGGAGDGRSGAASANGTGGAWFSPPAWVQLGGGAAAAVTALADEDVLLTVLVGALVMVFMAVAVRRDRRRTGSGRPRAAVGRGGNGGGAGGASGGGGA
ncbi:unnamed protein product, partial [Phaeothamnion confervicola]